MLCFNDLTLFPIENPKLSSFFNKVMLILCKQCSVFLVWPSRFFIFEKNLCNRGRFILVVMSISWYLWAGNIFQIAFHKSIFFSLLLFLFRSLSLFLCLVSSQWIIVIWTGILIYINMSSVKPFVFLEKIKKTFFKTFRIGVKFCSFTV